MKAGYITNDAELAGIQVGSLLANPGEDRVGAEGSRIALGQSAWGRKALTADKRRRARKPGRA
jgi:hypothetical protein